MHNAYWIYLFTLLASASQAQEVLSRYKWRQMNGSDSEYFLSEITSDTHDSWYHAREFCMKQGGDIVVIHSKEEMDQLMQWSTEKPYYDYDWWIGFYNLDRTGFKWVDGSTIDFTKWAPGFPETQHYGRLCAYVKSRTEVAGEWYNQNCALESKGVICKRPYIGSSTPIPKTTPTTIPPTQLGYCPHGFVNAGSKCFKIVSLSEDTGVTFEEAIGRCRLEPGYLTDIASIHSSYENAIIVAEMQRYNMAGLWIGLYQGEKDPSRPSSPRPWYWVDNSITDFEYWEKGIADRWGADCACMVYRHPPMSHTGMWNNSKQEVIDCKVRKGYICQAFKNAQDIISTSPITTTNSCPSDSQPFANSCYTVFTEAKTWADANKTCVDRGSKLVSIHSDTENAFLFTLIARKVKQDVWIGLYEYEEADKEYRWTDHWVVMYTRWAKYEPDRKQDGGCVAMATDEGLWYDQTCSETKPFICETTTDPPITTPVHIEGKCPNEDWFAWGDNCYWFVKRGGSDWFTAQAKCKGLHEDANLLSIHNEVENDMIYKNMETTVSYSHDIWIGLYRGQNDGEFTWVDRSALVYEHWRPGSPSTGIAHENHCVSMSVYKDKHPKTWEDIECTGLRNYVCKIPKRPIPTTPPVSPGRCPSSLWEHYGRHCYLLEPDSFASWDTARRECARHGGPSATIASVEGEHENDFLFKSMLAKSNLPRKRDFWLGGKKDGAGKDYYWVDGTSFEYNDWATDYPSSDPNSILNCMHMSIDVGKWKNRGCAQILGYVCKMEKLLGDLTTAADSDDNITMGEWTTASSPRVAPMHGGSVAAIILGICLAVLVALNITYCFLNSNKAPKTIAGFKNPLSPNNAGSGSDYVAWTAIGRHGSTKSEGGKAVVNNTYDSIA